MHNLIVISFALWLANWECMPTEYYIVNFCVIHCVSIAFVNGLTRCKKPERNISKAN